MKACCYTGNSSYLLDDPIATHELTNWLTIQWQTDYIVCYKMTIVNFVYLIYVLYNLYMYYIHICISFPDIMFEL